MGRIRFEQYEGTDIICLTAWMNLGDEQDVCEMKVGTIDALNENSVEAHWHPAQGSEILCMSQTDLETIFLKVKEVNENLSDKAIVEEVSKEQKLKSFFIFKRSR